MKRTWSTEQRKKYNATLTKRFIRENNVRLKSIREKGEELEQAASKAVDQLWTELSLDQKVAALSAVIRVKENKIEHR